MNSQKRKFTAEKKAEIVRRHLADKVPVSQLAEEFGLQPSQIHKWIRIVLEQAHRAFENEKPNQHVEQSKDRKIEQLEAKLVVKNEVIAELMEENVKAKKEFGEL
jgi:transposase-like protein